MHAEPSSDIDALGAALRPVDHPQKVSFLPNDHERVHQRQRAVDAVGGLRPQRGGNAVPEVPCVSGSLKTRLAKRSPSRLNGYKAVLVL